MSKLQTISLANHTFARGSDLDALLMQNVFFCESQFVRLQYKTENIIRKQKCVKNDQ